MAYVMGDDVSTHNSDAPRYWQPQVSYNKGMRFSYIKVGDGGSNRVPFKDIDFDVHWQTCNPIMPWGAYWFWRPEVDAVAQGAMFANIIKTLPYRLPPMFDVERNDLGYSPNIVADRLLASISAFKAIIPNKKLGIYTRFSFWNNPLTGVATRSFWRDYYLFVARYPEPQPTFTRPNPYWDNDARYRPRPSDWNIDYWTFWQFTERLPGAEWGSASSWLDGDYFNGDQQAFNEFIGVPMEIPSKIYVSLATGLNLVDVTNGVKYGLVPQGTKLVVDGSFTDSAGIVWYKTGRYYLDSRYVRPLA